LQKKQYRTIKERFLTFNGAISQKKRDVLIVRYRKRHEGENLTYRETSI